MLAMTAPRTLVRSAAIAATIILAGVGTACSSTTDSTSTAEPSTTSVIVHSATASATSSTTQAASTSTAAGNGISAPCGTVTSGANQLADVYIGYGQLSCADAVGVFTRYLSDTSLPKEGSGGHAAFDGWQCITTSFGLLKDLGYDAGCVRDRDAARAIIVDHGAPPPQKAKDPATYADPDVPAGGVHFQSPTGFWHCGIEANAAGCSGAMPATAPTVSSPFTGNTNTMRPNLVQVKTGQPASFGATEDAGYYRPDASILDYGDTLTANGFTCSVDYTRGVTCTAAGHGFTVSKQAFELR